MVVDDRELIAIINIFCSGSLRTWATLGKTNNPIWNPGETEIKS